MALSGSSQCFPGSSHGKECACNAGDPGLIPGLGRSPGGGHGNPLQYSCLENPMDRGAWRLQSMGSLSSYKVLQKFFFITFLFIFQNFFHLTRRLFPFFQEREEPWNSMRGISPFSSAALPAVIAFLGTKPRPHTYYGLADAVRRGSRPPPPYFRAHMLRPN